MSLALFAGREPGIPTREKTVAVYGGNSIPVGTPLFKFCEKVGKSLGESGFGVLTGGGGGAMQAVAQGANTAGAHTIGMAMPFIGEKPFQGNKEIEEYDTFSARIDDGYERRAALTAAVPGGMGTYQEITKKAVELYLDKTLYPSQKQIVLFEYKDFWKKFIDYLKEGPIAFGLMNPKFLDLFKVVNSIPEGVELLQAPKKEVGWAEGVKGQAPSTRPLELVA